MDTKECNKCNRTLPVSEFYPRRDRPGQYRSSCKVCGGAASAKWQRENPEKASAAGKRFYYKNSEAEVRRAQEHQKSNPDQKRNWYLMSKYNMSLAEFQALEAAQEYRCAGCGNEEDVIVATSSKRRNLHVDHCHKTGTNRGLLCTRCNLALGYLLDDPERIKGLLSYIEKWNG